MGFETEGNAETQVKDISIVETETKIVETNSYTDYAIKTHKKFLEDTHLIKNDRDEIDMVQLNEVLMRYPGNYAWAIVESARLDMDAKKLKDDFEIWWDQTYLTSGTACAREMGKKPTKDDIKSYMVSKNIDILRAKQEEMRISNAKADAMKGLTRVWSTVVNVLQSLSKNISAEFELTKRNIGA